MRRLVLIAVLVAGALCFERPISSASGTALSSSGVVARRTASPAAEPVVRIASAGGRALGPADDGPVIVRGVSMPITVHVTNAPAGAWLVLVGGRSEGSWSVLQGGVAVASLGSSDGRGTLEWSTRAALGPIEERRFDRVRASLVRAMLPVGSLSTIGDAAIASSREVRLVFSARPQGSLRIVAVAGRQVEPYSIIPVAQFETITIIASGVQPGRTIQLVIQPVDNDAYWIADGFSSLIGTRWTGTAFFGRAPTATAGRNDLDTFKRFRLWAVATEFPLPVRSRQGVPPGEFVDLAPLVQAASSEILVLRVTDGEVRVRILRNGIASDGAQWLVSRSQRIEGSLEFDPRYLPKAEVFITLLVRAAGDPTWSVAGSTHPSRNRMYWTIAAADFGEKPGERRAIAVATERPIPSGPVTSATLLRRDLLGLSDEVAFRVVDR
jgi:hypothetical protein